MEKVKVDGVSSGVRTRPKNKLDPSKDDIFSTGKRNEAGRKLYARFDCLFQLFIKLEGGRGGIKERKERQRHSFSL